MKFAPTPLSGCFVIEPEPHVDERGSFTRTWCSEELNQAGLVSVLAQCSVSRNTKAGTLRGMHYQISPHQETKIVSCSRGNIFDVIVDTREGSPTFGQWYGLELSPENNKALYIAEGMAHGFITLSDNCDVYYQISKSYVPESACGFCWNDPEIGIVWPRQPAVISERDASYPKLGKNN